MKTAEVDFMSLEESDFKILLMLMKRSVEFSRLEYSDQEVLVWFLIHSPNRVKSWIDYLEADYNGKRPTSIKGRKLYNEIKDLL